MKDVRCPRCNHLLARRSPDGSLTVRYSATGRSRKYRVEVTVAVGEVTCMECNSTVFSEGPATSLRDHFEA